MMTQKFLAVFALSLFIAGCREDGVPEVKDPNNILVDGVKMTQGEFLEKYCLGKRDNKTCLTVLQAKKHRSTRGEMPKNW